MLTFQTLQEIGTMLRRGVCAYLFVLNNDGYEIERQIHGVMAKYNDIQMYDHQLLLPFLAGKGCKVCHLCTRIVRLSAD
jgi:pyruvate decarboxylase